MNSVLEGNKLIAEFMGENYSESPKYDSLTIIRDDGGYQNLLLASYHDEWSWIMPVLREIGDRTGHELVMHSETSYWNQFGDNMLPTEFLGYGYPIQDGIWLAVVEFIKWYNNK